MGVTTSDRTTQLKSGLPFSQALRRTRIAKTLSGSLMMVGTSSLTLALLRHQPRFSLLSFSYTLSGTERGTGPRLTVTPRDRETPHNLERRFHVDEIFTQRLMFTLLACLLERKVDCFQGTLLIFNFPKTQALFALFSWNIQKHQWTQFSLRGFVPPTQAPGR